MPIYKWTDEIIRRTNRTIRHVRTKVKVSKDIIYYLVKGTWTLEALHSTIRHMKHSNKIR